MKDDSKNKKNAIIEDTEDLNKEDAETKQLREENEEIENKYKRALADYQNLEKRVLEDRRNWIISANKELILRLLPVLDTLMLADKHVSDQGLKLSIQQFMDVLKTEGVKKIETKDKEFDPKTMECVQVSDGKEGKVLEEARAGYMLNEEVLRPAQVVAGGKASS